MIAFLGDEAPQVAVAAGIDLQAPGIVIGATPDETVEAWSRSWPSTASGTTSPPSAPDQSAWQRPAVVRPAWSRYPTRERDDRALAAYRRTTGPRVGA